MHAPPAVRCLRGNKRTTLTGYGNLTVTLITILIITGLVIDLGGAPGQQRLGFHVRSSLLVNS